MKFRKVDAVELRRLLGQRHVTLSCPMCRHNDWWWDQTLRVLAQVDWDSLELKLDRELLPVLTLMCKRCGYTALFHPLFAGLVSDGQEAQPGH